MPEPWLRGPLPEITPLLQPAAHAFIMAREGVEAAASRLSHGQLWLRPQGIASVGFNIAHLAGSTDRLMTYARGEGLSDTQRSALDRETKADEERRSLEDLLVEWHMALATSLEQLSSTPESALLEPRLVGRAQLPSNVLGLLFHAAEHASRHTGQIVTTAKLLRGLAEARGAV